MGTTFLELFWNLFSIVNFTWFSLIWLILTILLILLILSILLTFLVLLIQLIFYIFIKISQTIKAIIKNIPFVIKTRQSNFTNVKSSNSMQFTLNFLHFMPNKIFIKQKINISFMSCIFSNIFIDYFAFHYPQ